MNKWQKIKIATISLVSAAVIASSFVILLWDVDTPTAISTYTLNFETTKSMTDKEKQVVNNKNEFIKAISTNAKNIIDNYQKESNNDESLIFNFANLSAIQTQGEINYFNSLNRSLKEISPDLGINNQQRTPKLVAEAFNNKNTELMSFYWSPDYNSVGTWLKYMFTDSYTMPNMWPPTYAILNRYRTISYEYDQEIVSYKNNPNPKARDASLLKIRDLERQMTRIAVDYPWANSLAKELNNIYVPGTNEKLLKSPIEILNFIPSTKNKTGIRLDDYYVLLANYIGSWVKKNSRIPIYEKEVFNPVTQMKETITTYSSQIPAGISYVNWIASQNPNIPYQEVGAGTETPYLCSTGLYMPTNPNADINFRDWYYYNNEFTESMAKDWWISDPFKSNATAWNGPFSIAPNSLYAQSVWTSLTSWTTIGDSNDSKFPGGGQPVLVGNGITNDISNQGVLSNYKTTYLHDRKIVFNIRPIPWVDSKGNPTGEYLSPADFHAGFKAFLRSIENNMNASNAYFQGLASIDFVKTLNYGANKLVNKTPKDNKTFTIFFDKPVLDINDIMDIFQKQYFMALPHSHPKVQNIIDDEKYNKIAVTNPSTGYLNVEATDMTQFYGVGTGYDPNVWQDLWSAAPYYISNVDQQSITYNLNKYYFEAFDNMKFNKNYDSFHLTKTLPDGSVVKKIEKINLKYAGSYNLDILYEQFKSGELNKTPLQSINLMSAINNQKQYLRYQKVNKINKSNVIGFNLQIYQKWNEPKDQIPKGCIGAENIIVDQDGNPMWDPKTRTVTYSIDRHGNYVWPEGKKPMRKSNVSQIYEDLIVSDFYTPINENGKSQAIRFAIMNSINWVSLKSLVTPGISASIQYSFMPYGAFDLTSANGNKSTYWDLAAHKRYLTEKELNEFPSLSKDPEDKKRLILKRMSGNMIWTYSEMVNSMIKINNK